MANAVGEKALRNALKQLDDNSVVDVKEGIETLSIYIDNIKTNPRDPRFRKIRVSNVNYQDRLGHLRGGQSLLEAIGFREHKQFLVLPENLYKEDQSEIEVMSQIVQKHRDIFGRKFNEVNRPSNSHRWKCVIHAVCADDIGERQYMEDDYVFVDSFCGDDKTAYFGLYDGHGGRQTVDFVVRSLHKNLEHHLRYHPDDPMEDVYRQVYERTDSQIRRMDILQSGSTSVTCVLRQEKEKKILHVANCGDSRGVLCRRGRAIRLTRDHKPQDPSEKSRVVAAGGFIGRFDRVNGILAVSRALGDHMLKPAVSSVPYYARYEVHPTADKFMVLACDGLWDVISDQEACDFVRNELLNRLPEEERDAAIARAEEEAQTSIAVTPVVEEPTETKEGANANGDVLSASTEQSAPSASSSSASSSQSSIDTPSSSSPPSSSDASQESSALATRSESKSPPSQSTSKPSQDATDSPDGKSDAASDAPPVSTPDSSSPSATPSTSPRSNGHSDKEKRSADEPVTTKPDQPAAKKAKSTKDGEPEDVEPDPAIDSEKIDSATASDESNGSADSTDHDKAPPLSPHAQSKGKTEVALNGESETAAEDDDDDDDEVAWPPVVPSFSEDHIRTNLHDVTKALIQAALDKRTLDNITVMIVWF